MTTYTVEIMVKKDLNVIKTLNGAISSDAVDLAKDIHDMNLLRDIAISLAREISQDITDM